MIWALVALAPMPGRADDQQPAQPISTALTPVAESLPLAPRSVEDLLLIQHRTTELVKQVLPCVVGVSMGGGQGSGVIVSADGYVLTAAHVNVEPGRNVTFILHDGRRVKGKTLGLDRSIDAGLMKISDPGPWPFAPMGQSSLVGPGDWVMAVGHPGGYMRSRPPVVRLGRVISIGTSTIQTDCTLVGGDSGGPLFDLDGNVVGIHSRINNSITANYHVPVDPYRDTWDRLAAGEVWGQRRGARAGQAESGTFLGINGRDEQHSGCRINTIVPGSPAEQAGLRIGDLILEMSGSPVSGIQNLAERVGRRKPGDKVSLLVDREGQRLTIHATLGSRR